MENKEALEKVNKSLEKAISIIILLENDMLIQNGDGIGASAVKVVHDILKSAQQQIKKLFT